jgi:D-2-hydroxyglutarate dehydrogenase
VQFTVEFSQRNFESASLLFNVLIETDSNFIHRSPIEKYPFYVLIETRGSNEAHDSEKLTNFLKNTMEKSVVLDGTVTSDPGKMQSIWECRERIAEACAKDTYCFKYDLTLPLSHFYEIVPDVKKRLGDQKADVFGYGHVGKKHIMRSFQVQ